ncbi:MAG: class I SAM-dependent DNA methyltransferase [Allosphingosinicella sp.]|uniref:class I SAM-dependent DNA methyltransferase n=1 Tax=Allosphingosinicella sp. TaxID=2823234 RepID=UPI0039233EB6
MTDLPASDHPLENTPFDRALRRLRRDRAARLTTEPHPLLVRMAEEIEERLAMVSRRFERALDLGAGPGLLGQQLRAQGIEVASADAGALFADHLGGTQCDEDRLPFPSGTFDLVVSAGTLDSVNDLPGALVQIRRLLKPDGLFLAAFAGAGSLPLLRQAMRAADEAEDQPASPRLHPQIDIRAAGDLLGRAGFALPVADSEKVSVRFPTLDRLVGDLRELGWTNILSARSRRPIGRLGLAAAKAAFAEAADVDGRATERFEIIHLSGWAPSPDQPQPARRGSGTVSLAEALRRKN